MPRCLATREGLVGKMTASGWIINRTTFFAALPARRALHRKIRITNPLNGKSCEATILDVGPHNERDNAYVFDGARPLAEQGFHTIETGKPPVPGNTNGAGIDLGEAVWNALEMRDNSNVDWSFIDDPQTA
jgi:hypothetical protein